MIGGEEELVVELRQQGGEDHCQLEWNLRRATAQPVRL